MGGDEPAGRVMLVAGGTGSIGGAIAAHALAAGWRVALHGRTDGSVRAALARLAPAGDGGLAGFAADATRDGEIERLAGHAAGWRGRLDAVVDCVSAGPAARIAGAFAQTEPAGYATHLALSLGHLQRLAFAAVPLLARQGGTLVAFASDAGRFAAAGQSLIGASRAGIVGFVRNLAVEVARDGVRVHCVSSGFVDDTASARRLEAASAERMARARARAGLGLPTPDDVAPLVLFLCGDGARRITGQVVSVNGGLNA